MHRGPKRLHSLDLTEEQQAEIESITTEALKENVPIRSKLKTLRAELGELLIVENPNRGAINRKIDEIGSLRTEMQKSHVDTRLRVRALLTEEQRVKFDAMRTGGHRGKRMMRHGGRPGRMGGMPGARPGRFGDAGELLPEFEEEVEVVEF